MQNNKTKQTFVIHRLLHPPSCEHALPRHYSKRFIQVIYLLHSAPLTKESRDIPLQQTAELYLLAE